MPNRLIKRIKNVKNEGQNADTEKGKTSTSFNKSSYFFNFCAKVVRFSGKPIFQNILFPNLTVLWLIFLL